MPPANGAASVGAVLTSISSALMPNVSAAIWANVGVRSRQIDRSQHHGQLAIGVESTDGGRRLDAAWPAADRYAHASPLRARGISVLPGGMLLKRQQALLQSDARPGATVWPLVTLDRAVAQAKLRVDRDRACGRARRPPTRSRTSLAALPAPGRRRRPVLLVKTSCPRISRFGNR